MVEAAAEATEELMDKYLDDGDLTEDEIIAGIRAAHARDVEIIPVFCGTAFKNKGVQAMLDAVDPAAAVAGRSSAGQGHRRGRQGRHRTAGDDEPFSALAFKIMTDPFVGSLTFFRVYSGTLNSGDTVYNPVKSKKERVGRILQMHADERSEIKEVRAGDIAAAVGLKDVTTGDTLCATGQRDHARAHDVPGAGHLDGGRAEDQVGPGKDGHRAGRVSRRKIRRSACAPTRNPARRSSPAWASCTWKSSSTA